VARQKAAAGAGAGLRTVGRRHAANAVALGIEAGAHLAPFQRHRHSLTMICATPEGEEVRGDVLLDVRPVANGTYHVDLMMAEIYSGITGPGQRVFDMALEGQALPALQNIDIYSRVGANTALTISQQVTVTDGSLSTSSRLKSIRPVPVETRDSARRGA